MRLSPLQSGSPPTHPDIAVGCGRRAGVEAEPADPKQPGAGDAEDEVVRRHRVVVPPLAEDEAGHQPGDALIDVDHGAAGEIAQAAPDRQPPAAAERPAAPTAMTTPAMTGPLG